MSIQHEVMTVFLPMFVLSWESTDIHLLLRTTVTSYFIRDLIPWWALYDDSHLLTLCFRVTTIPCNSQTADYNGKRQNQLEMFPELEESAFY